ncbi:uncharacterized protein LOC125776439 isoform X1 [Bactrocera dorsalis]|uniref:Uncharacterized protein LOC125776439 isoform X1 n=1 Tax=Bactrocera dorsalis TaxID=27457 RepID=A0ABM3J4Y4_BACDO|nr:uncharacterized protein LOC125776439 isoform X1 [Bactrocera dorsalis]
MENRDKFALVKIKCELQMHETANQRCKEPNNQADCLRKVEWNVNHVFQPSNKFCGVHAQRRRNNGSYPGQIRKMQVTKCPLLRLPQPCSKCGQWASKDEPSHVIRARHSNANKNKIMGLKRKLQIRK